MTALVSVQVNNGGMPLQYLASRIGRRGRPVSDERIRRMAAIVDEVGRHEIAITAPPILPPDRRN
jgi:hypothetical protein